MKLKNNESGIAHIAAIVVVVVFVAIGVVGWKVWDNQKSSDTKKNTAATTTGSAKKETSNSTSTDKADATPAATTDEQVIAAVKAYCNASIDPTTKKPLVLKVGTAGASQKQVLYSSDKNFAYVNAVCSTDGTTEGSGSAYYLKKIDGSWVFIYRGQMPSEEYTAKFNIPADSDFN